MWTSIENAAGLQRLALHYEKALKRIARIKEATGAGHAINAADKIARHALARPPRSSKRGRM